MELRDLLIGLTYDLRDDYAGMGLSEEELAEFDRADTIERLEEALRELGHRTDRIGNVQALVGRLQAGDRWDLVFNIAEGRFGSGREAQVPALLDAYSVPYTFSDPLACALTLHKAATKHVLRDLGIPTPRFALVSNAAEIARVDLTYPLFAKPVAEGTSKGIDAHSVVRSPEELRERCEALLARHRQAVLVEEYLPGRELTIGVLGTGDQTRAVGALEVELLEGADAEVYTFRNKEECETLVRYSLADDELAAVSSALAVRTWRALDCRDGGRVDVRCDAKGRPQVMEVNPLPGMHPEHSDLPILWHKGGRAFVDLVGAIVVSACERVGTERVVNTPRVAAPVATNIAVAVEPSVGAESANARVKHPSLAETTARVGQQPKAKPARAASAKKPAGKAKATKAGKTGKSRSAAPAAKKVAVAKPTKSTRSATGKAKTNRGASAKAKRPAAPAKSTKTGKSGRVVAATKKSAGAKPTKNARATSGAAKTARGASAKAKRPAASTKSAKRPSGTSASKRSAASPVLKPATRRTASARKGATKTAVKSAPKSKSKSSATRRPQKSKRS